MNLPEEYVATKFLQYTGGGRYVKNTETYQGSCCICHEGSSWLKKRRCYYIPAIGRINCFNCGWSGTAVDWIHEVTGDSIGTILNEARNYDLIPRSIASRSAAEEERKVPTLPTDSINLLSDQQLRFYKENKTVTAGLDLIAKRRLGTAVNRPKSLWLSLVDHTHANRLVIPFYDIQGGISYYQTRRILDDGTPKYLSKSGGVKGLFGVDRVDEGADCIFINEGPINAFFCKNAVAVAGIQENSDNTFTTRQQQQITAFPLHRKIWVLDSQWLDQPSYKKTARLIDIGEEVFIWPKDLGAKYKDFNDIAIDRKVDSIDPGIITSNTFSGATARLKLAAVTR